MQFFHVPIALLCGLQSSAHASAMEAIQLGVTLRRAPRPAEKEGKALSLHDTAMDSIKKGVSLRSVPRPPERKAGEERVVDVASELRQKMLKQRKHEV